jgi:hypothetical protein
MCIENITFFCDTIDIDILKIPQKGNEVNVLERFYIYKAAKHKPIMNECFVSDSNILFDLVTGKDTGKM